MDRLKTLWPILVIFSIITGFCIWYFQGKSTINPLLWQREEVIQQEKDSLLKEIDSLQVIIKIRAAELDSLKKVYPDMENKILIINAEVNEKISSLDTLTRSEFKEFFARRYPKR